MTQSYSFKQLKCYKSSNLTKSYGEGFRPTQNRNFLNINKLEPRGRTDWGKGSLGRESAMVYGPGLQLLSIRLASDAGLLGKHGQKLTFRRVL